MTYQLTETGSIRKELENGSVLFLPAESNGTAAWAEYQAWLNKGNIPLPAPEPPPPGPDYQAFWEGLMASSLYAAIREQSMASLPMNTLGTEFIALLSDAKAGRPYKAAIQASMAAILQTGTFTEEQLAELQGILDASHLSSIYSLTALFRARNEDGTFVADDPATPENEAYVEVPLGEA